MTSGPGPGVLVLGCGSAGGRHARLLAAAGAAVSVYDPDPGRRRATAARIGATEVSDPGAFDFDGVVVASPTARHADQVRAALAGRAKVLVEKPMTVEPDEARALAGVGGDRLAVAYNLRYHAPLRRLADVVASGVLGPVVSGRVWFGQWLPDWRPTEDYRLGYSARRELGGGILLDASHELDVVRWLFGSGPFEVLGAAVDRLGPLEIDVEDTVAALLRGPAGVLVTVSLDCLSRRYRRGVEVVGTEGTVRLDWARGVLEVEGPAVLETTPADEPLEAAYAAQARAFLAWLADRGTMAVGAADGAEVVALAGAVAAAAG